MADENKSKEELDNKVEESDAVEDGGLAEALGLGDDVSEDVSEDPTGTDAADESEADEEVHTSEEAASSEEEDDDEIVALPAPVPAALPVEDDLEDEEDDDDVWPTEEDSDPSEEIVAVVAVPVAVVVETPAVVVITHEDDEADGLAAYFDDPNELLHAAEEARDEGFQVWDTFSPFPIHGIEDAMGIGRSWLPWVTFGAGGTGFLLANALQFGTLTFDWPMIIGGKPHAPWPSFVPIMFELTVLIGGVTTALVMFIASRCFRKPRIIDPEITNDRFVLWIDSKDPKYGQAREFMTKLDPVEIRTVTF